MLEIPEAVIAIPIACLFALAALPPSWSNNHVLLVRRSVTMILAIQTVAALMVLVKSYFFGPVAIKSSAVSLSGAAPIDPAIIELSAYLDGVSCLMFLMVSLVGFVVSRFSIRYLDGEATQGRYFRWLGFTIAAVSTMTISGNLLMFFAAWVMTSFGLHQLLLHYRHRAAAHRAAWTKFTISRIGDAFLVAALIVTFQSFGTFDFVTLFERAAEIADGGRVTVNQMAIGWLIVFGAMTKSAQFPFHTWLPNTMETPTPVSALMHAGIVNAGGYLVVRTGSLVTLAPTALAVLAAIGAFTACFGAIVMITQPSIKRALAYSTIAQMGFMMLQCGLGAFAAAMLHIVAHSFYKAYAFLNSGSVIAESRSLDGTAQHVAQSTERRWAVPVAFALSAISLACVLAILGIDITAKVGGLTFALIICLALTTWGWRLLQSPQRNLWWVATFGIPMLCLLYGTSYAGISMIVAGAIPTVSGTAWTTILVVDVALAFCLLFMLHAALRNDRSPIWLESLRIHAANEFYIDVIYRRVFGSLAKS
ncbi:proton-conducting transporter transmembrane domain-containing protein [Roseiconus lacunae]|uniref:proton-conducting transporter transmembrane domain-containing protein n=1 Tax=Roseiconus lacunae TaxID=2605694 RepID=UPI0011F10B92|nr:proton-conducting transporter membrane subunit [Roseiconus lacunae]